MIGSRLLEARLTDGLDDLNAAEFRQLEAHIGSDYATVAYSSAGVPLWTNRYNGSSTGDDEAWAIAVASSGNVFVTGVSTGADGNHDYATVGYSEAGVPLWTNRYAGAANGEDEATAITVDGSGNVFVTGGSTNIAGGYDFGTVAYSIQGVPLWTNRYRGPGPGGGFADAIAVDMGGNVVVAGSANGVGSGPDYATIKYSTSVRPYLAIEGIGDKVLLTWTNSGFNLQSAPAITGPYGLIVGATSPYTNSMTDSQQYFRLTAP